MLKFLNMISDSVLKELDHCFDSSDCELLGSAQACKPFVSHSVFGSATNPRTPGFPSQLLQVDLLPASMPRAAAFPMEKSRVPDAC